ncbi:MAG: hypothetical protein O7G85_14075 [Planctomycetota bacterium]|nr:hypothetical protein [Planctomycetota bacterium]
MTRLLLILLTSLALTGCAPSEGPSFLVIDQSIYHKAFDAADEAIRAVSMPPTLRDRRSGIIETEPRIAGSILEPWRSDNASFDQAMENTISFQRRRVRIEFTPAGFDPSTLDEDVPLPGPDLLGLESTPWDLTTHEGEIELRVWVYLERSYTFGVRRSPWSKRYREQMTIIETNDVSQSTSGTGTPADPASLDAFKDEDRRRIKTAHWTPVSRDPAFERWLLEEIRKRLDKTG